MWDRGQRPRAEGVLTEVCWYLRGRRAKASAKNSGMLKSCDHNVSGWQGMWGALWFSTIQPTTLIEVDSLLNFLSEHVLKYWNISDFFLPILINPWMRKDSCVIRIHKNVCKLGTNSILRLFVCVVIYFGQHRLLYTFPFFSDRAT